MGQKQTSISAGAMGIGLFLLGLFGDTLVGDKVGVFLAAIGIALTVFALVWPLFLRWQFGHPTRQSPINFGAYTVDAPFPVGTKVNEITWEEGFAYLQIRIRSLTNVPLKNLEAIIDLGDLWIAEARVREAPSDVTIAAIGSMTPVAAQATSIPTGEIISLPVQLHKSWTGCYRLSCQTFGTAGEIVAELAIVEPKSSQEALSSAVVFRPVAPRLEALLISASFDFAGEQIQFEGELPVAKIDR